MVKQVKKPGISLKIKTKKVFWTVVLLLAIFVAKLAGLPIDFLFDGEKTRQTTDQADLTEGVYDVERCVDGDTFILSNASRTRIRLIGADTPETVKPNSSIEPFGLEASEFTKVAIARNGNKVRITFDGTKIDRYGRTLAMVWLDEGDTLLNEELIRVGLARAQLQYNYSREMKYRFQTAEDQAKREKRGIWSLTTGS